MKVPPFFYRRLFSNPPNYELRTNNSELKNVYLTFDDGPIPEITEIVIDTLNKYKAKATFFCVGNNIEKNHKEFEILNNNKQHAIGNHTFNHLNGWKTRNNDYFENVFQCQKIINFQILNPNSQLFRPPYGKMTLSQIAFLKKYFKIYLWSVLSYDFDAGTSPDKCLKNVINNAKPNSIIVFHDNIKAKKNLYYALPRAPRLLIRKTIPFRESEFVKSRVTLLNEYFYTDYTYPNLPEKTGKVSTIREGVKVVFKDAQM